MLFSRLSITTLTILVTLAPAPLPVAAAEAATEGRFPEPEAIEGNVGFWISVFSDWRVGQIVVHDLRHPALVFDVADLPGKAEGRYTSEQQDFVDDLRDRWKSYLRYLELHAGSEETLDDVDRQWILHIASHAGSDGLRGAYKRVRSQRGLRERFHDGLEHSYRYIERIQEIFRDHGLPEDLAYLPHVESSFQYHARSSAGATGIWQFTRGTGKQYLTINSAIDERLDPIAATFGAAAYLRDAYDTLGTWPLAVTSYNHGVQGMRRAKERYGVDFGRIYREYDGRSFGFASKNFYAEFLAAREIARNPSHYFPEGHTPEPPPDHDQIVLERRTSPQRLASYYGVDLDVLVSLNPAWSGRATRRAMALPVGTRIWLPGGTVEQDGSRRHPAPGDGYHVVGRGDTLSEIAARHGIPLATLRELNDLPATGGVIHPGQRLTLTARTGEELHEVRRGETLSGIAAHYGVQIHDLLSANTLTLKAVIHPGQLLRIPSR